MGGGGLEELDSRKTRSRYHRYHCYHPHYHPPAGLTHGGEGGGEIP